MSVSKRLRYEVLRRDGHACKYCGATASDVELTVDHVVPTALGGTDAPGNLVTACGPCNSGKSASHPDAPLVADVARDAVRWSQAQQVAAQQMLDQLNSRNVLGVQFKRKWDAWTYGADNVRMPLPVNWASSVETFLTAGLPMPVLLDCVDKAMSRKHVKPDSVFRYMCGIAWSKVTELQNATRTLVDGSPVPASASESAPSAQRLNYGFVAEVLAALGLTMDGWLDLVNQELPEVDEEDEGPLDPSERAMVRAVLDVTARMYRYGSVLEGLLDSLPEDRLASLKENAEAELRRDGMDVTDSNVLVRSAWFLQAEYCRAYLDTLPEAERDEWKQWGATYTGEDPESPYALWAAGRYARTVKAGGQGSTNMCDFQGDSGAMCPKLATCAVWFKECTLCTGFTCHGHVICERHLDAAKTGQADAFPSGRPAVVDKVAFIDEPQAVKY